MPARVEAMVFRDRKAKDRIKKAIVAGLVVVGQELLAIRETPDFYKEKYVTFAAYCKQRWDMTDQYARGLIKSSEVIAALKPNNCLVLPTTESQCRPLTTIVSPTRARTRLLPANPDKIPTLSGQSARDKRDSAAYSRPYRYGQRRAVPVPSIPRPGGSRKIVKNLRTLKNNPRIIFQRIWILIWIPRSFPAGGAGRLPATAYILGTSDNIDSVRSPCFRTLDSYGSAGPLRAKRDGCFPKVWCATKFRIHLYIESQKPIIGNVVRPDGQRKKLARPGSYGNGPCKKTPARHIIGEK